MLKNYWRIAFRNLWKHKGFSFINLAGLTVALSCCLLMLLYIRHELSFDKFQVKGDRVVRVIMEYGFGESETVKGNFTSTKVMPAFKRNFPEVEEGVRMDDGGGLVKVGDKIFEERKFLYADSTFFKVFPSFTLQSGNPEKVLEAPNQVVVSASTAKRYFGDKNAVGQIILVGSKQTPYAVTGVADDCPFNSQIRFDLLASFSSFGPAQEETYWNANYTTYLLLKDANAINRMQPKIRPFIKAEIKDPAVNLTFHLEPYTSIHLHSPFDAFEPNSNITYIYIAAAMAVLILLIACFTYVNMSTARSLERSREVGIRKVAGASKKQVFWQFIGESALLASSALLLSILAVYLLLPGFNRLVARDLSMSALFTPSIIGAGIAMIACISLLAGSYPALVLSGFQPVKVLKGSFRNSNSGHMVRQSLTVFQFAISAFLLIASFVIQKQFRYIQNKSLGFNRDHSMVIQMDEKVGEKIDLLKTEFKTNPQVKNVSRAVSLPVQIVGGYNMRSAVMPENTNLNVYASPIDDEYISANQLELVAGKDISRQDVLDAGYEDEKNFFHFILNESAAKQLGWTPKEAVGKKMFLDGSRPGIVNGVVKDFHFASLHTPIKGLVLFPSNWGNKLIVKLSGAQLPETIAFLEKKWKESITHRPFNYTFMDDEFNKLYATERQTGTVISLFSAVAILLACTGLLGLSAFAVQQRIKEIGVRKVLGASSAGIVWMLAGKFLRLVVIAFIIAIPLGWLAANKWLEDFTYRTSINAGIFILAAFSLALLALLAISVQTLRAAMANPVKSLRTE